MLTERDDVAIDDLFDAAPRSEFGQFTRFGGQSFQYFVGKGEGYIAVGDADELWHVAHYNKAAVAVLRLPYLIAVGE